MDRVWAAVADSSYRNFMRTFLKRLSMLLPVLLAGCAGGDGRPPPQPVAQVDLSRYAGKWYEIARVPNSFQDHCAGNVTAEYAVRDDGRLDVTNRCLTDDGKIDIARGIARRVDDSNGARLEVSFFKIAGWRPIWGDYWILGLDRGYNWAVVGDGKHDNGWILARAPRLTDTERDRINALLREQGYEPAAFIRTPQDLVADPAARHR